MSCMSHPLKSLFCSRLVSPGHWEAKMSAKDSREGFSGSARESQACLFLWAGMQLGTKQLKWDKHRTGEIQRADPKQPENTQEWEEWVCLFVHKFRYNLEYGTGEVIYLHCQIFNSKWKVNYTYTDFYIYHCEDSRWLNANLNNFN